MIAFIGDLGTGEAVLLILAVIGGIWLIFVLVNLLLRKRAVRQRSDFMPESEKGDEFELDVGSVSTTGDDADRREPAPDHDLKPDEPSS